MEYFDVIYTEVNTKYLYKNCALINEIDEFLESKNFKRIITKMTNNGWGDAIYVHNRVKNFNENSVVMKNFGGYARLGNRMFQYAALKAFSLKNNIKIRENSSDLIGLCNLFPNVSYNCSIDYDKEIIINEDDYFSFRNNDSCSIINLNGYFQSLDFFKEYESEIRNCFEFTNDVKSICENFLIKTNLTEKDGVNLIGIHIRLEDTIGETDFIYNLPTKEYILESLTKIPLSSTKENVILIFSNNINETKKRFDSIFTHEHYYINQTIELDLCLYSMCNHNIMTTGSFGWWGAFLNKNQNTVVGMKEWYRQDIPRVKNAQKDNLFPKSWILI